MKQPIYLDHAATTDILPEALAATAEALAVVGNPSSAHACGRRAHRALQEARERVAGLIGAPAECVTFTSGGTEAINWAIGGILFNGGQGGGHITTTAMEHHAVADAVRRCRETLGCEATAVKPQADGVLAVEGFTAALRPDTRLAAVMAVCNETGACQPIAQLAALCRGRDIPFFCDAVQAVGQLAVDAPALGVDLLAFTAHKLGGPPGVGALYIREGVTLPPLLVGGGQENGRRAGTPNLPAIVGFGVAARQVAAHLAKKHARIAALRQHLQAGLAALPGVSFNTPAQHCAPGILSVTFEGLSAQTLHMFLDLAGVAVSLGAACGAGIAQPSHVLLAMGRTPEQARGTLRFSLGATTTQADIDTVLAIMPGLVEKARGG